MQSDHFLLRKDSSNTCNEIIMLSTIMFIVLYTILILVIVVMWCKYSKQKKEIEFSRTQPGTRSEADEWLLVNKLVNEMKHHGSSTTNSRAFTPEERNSKYYTRKTRPSERSIKEPESGEMNRSKLLHPESPPKEKMQFNRSIDSNTSLGSHRVDRLSSLKDVRDIMPQKSGMEALRTSLLE